MKNDPRYTPSSCFQTFPFPQSNPDTDKNIHEVGQILYNARSDYMLKHQVGMTETWNRLMDKNNPYFDSDEIKKIREKRKKMDETVLLSYGWQDVDVTDDKSILFRLRKLNAFYASNF